ncbi:hypothetical protein T492DRAFT_1035142 [Pavlovales sp. CCMP2436]|nr:hypothetical protein T492DRAFT_1035142 [Pavlovales sp. CCMP2436]|mmetsp:Transcript_4961/g.12796  ORF Transcript_4961/g.12796 Transcript_4961/m.12796 type:complete len:290 (+) Transcript_4961:59-928(+)
MALHPAPNTIVSTHSVTHTHTRTTRPPPLSRLAAAGRSGSAAQFGLAHAREILHAEPSLLVRLEGAVAREHLLLLEHVRLRIIRLLVPLLRLAVLVHDGGLGLRRLAVRPRAVHRLAVAPRGADHRFGGVTGAVGMAACSAVPCHRQVVVRHGPVGGLQALAVRAFLVTASLLVLVVPCAAHGRERVFHAERVLGLVGQRTEPLEHVALLGAHLPQLLGRRAHHRLLAPRFDLARALGRILDPAQLGLEAHLPADERIDMHRVRAPPAHGCVGQRVLGGGQCQGQRRQC